MCVLIEDACVGYTYVGELPLWQKPSFQSTYFHAEEESSVGLLVNT